MSDEQTAAPWDAWYERACSMTLADLPAFINEMAEAGTDYNTTAEATGAAAVAAAWALAHTFGLTGFQGGWIMWQFMRHWNGVGEDGPARLLNYGDLLYPQMEEKFRVIDADTWEWAQEKAQELLAEQDEKRHPISQDVYRHWQSVAAGTVPFGMRVSPPATPAQRPGPAKGEA